MAGKPCGGDPRIRVHPARGGREIELPEIGPAREVARREEVLLRGVDETLEADFTHGEERSGRGEARKLPSAEEHHRGKDHRERALQRPRGDTLPG